jgi:hypothetical protein
MVNRLQIYIQLPPSLQRRNITLLTRLSHLVLTHTRGPRELGLITVGACSSHIMIIKMMGLPIPVVFLAEVYPVAALVLVLEPGLELAPADVAAAGRSVYEQ